MKIWGVPKTTLSFNNLLERVTQFRKTIRLVAPVYYNKRIKIKIRWKKQHIRQCLGKFQTVFQLSVPSGVKWTGLASSNDLWQHAWSTGNKITSLDFQCFYSGLVTYTWLTTHMVFTLQRLSCYHTAQYHIINHLITRDCPGSPRFPGRQIHFYQAGHFKV